MIDLQELTKRLEYLRQTAEVPDWKRMVACRDHGFPMPWISPTEKGPADVTCHKCWKATILATLKDCGV